MWDGRRILADFPPGQRRQLAGSGDGIIIPLMVLEESGVHGLVVDQLAAILRLKLNGGTKAEMSLEIEIRIEKLGLKKRGVDGMVEGRGHGDDTMAIERHDRTGEIHIDEFKKVVGADFDRIGGVERILAESAGVAASNDWICGGMNSQWVTVTSEAKFGAIAIEGLHLGGSICNLPLEWAGLFIDRANARLVDFTQG